MSSFPENREHRRNYVYSHMRSSSYTAPGARCGSITVWAFFCHLLARAAAKSCTPDAWCRRLWLPINWNIKVRSLMIHVAMHFLGNDLKTVAIHKLPFFGVPLLTPLLPPFRAMALILTFFISFLCGYTLAAPAASWTSTPFSPASIPLAVRSPYLSAWLNQGSGTALNADWPKFWTGSVNLLCAPSPCDMLTRICRL